MTDADRDDYDSPWKEALERYFPDFLALLFPRIQTAIDWSKGHEFLDKELQQVVRDAETGRRHADKLAKISQALEAAPGAVTLSTRLCAQTHPRAVSRARLAAPVAGGIG